MLRLLVLFGACLLGTGSALNCLNCVDSFYIVHGHKLGGDGICNTAMNSTECPPNNQCLSAVLEFEMLLEGSNIIAPITQTSKSCVPLGLSEDNLCTQVESTVYDQDVRNMACQAMMCDSENCNAESADIIPFDPDDHQEEHQQQEEEEEEEEQEAISREDYEKVVRCLECVTSYTLNRDGRVADSGGMKSQKCSRRNNSTICRFGNVCSIMKVSYDTSFGDETLHSTMETRSCAPNSVMAEEILCDEVTSNLQSGHTDCSVKLCEEDYCNDPKAAKGGKRYCPYKNKRKCQRYHAEQGRKG